MSSEKLTETEKKERQDLWGKLGHMVMETIEKNNEKRDEKLTEIMRVQQDILKRMEERDKEWNRKLETTVGILEKKMKKELSKMIKEAVKIEFEALQKKGERDHSEMAAEIQFSKEKEFEEHEINGEDEYRIEAGEHFQKEELETVLEKKEEEGKQKEQGEEEKKTREEEKKHNIEETEKLMNEEERKIKEEEDEILEESGRDDKEEKRKKEDEESEKLENEKLKAKKLKQKVRKERRRAKEQKRIAEKRKRRELARKQQLAAEQKKKAEAERKKIEEEEQKKEEIEKKKREEEERKKEEAERKKRTEEARKRKEEEKRKRNEKKRKKRKDKKKRKEGGNQKRQKKQKTDENEAKEEEISPKKKEEEEESTNLSIIEDFDEEKVEKDHIFLQYKIPNVETQVFPGDQIATVDTFYESFPHFDDLRNRVLLPGKWSGFYWKLKDKQDMAVAERMFLKTFQHVVIVIYCYESLLLLQKTKESNGEVAEKVLNFFREVAEQKKMVHVTVDYVKQVWESQQKFENPEDEEKKKHVVFCPKKNDTRAQFQETIENYQIALTKVRKEVQEAYELCLKDHVEAKLPKMKKRTLADRTVAEGKQKLLECHESLILLIHAAYIRDIRCRISCSETPGPCESCEKVLAELPNSEWVCLPKYSDVLILRYHCVECMRKRLTEHRHVVTRVVSLVNDVYNNQMNNLKLLHEKSRKLFLFVCKNQRYEDHERGGIPSWNYVPVEREKISWSKFDEEYKRDYDVYGKLLNEKNEEVEELCFKVMIHTRVTIWRMEYCARELSKSSFSKEAYERLGQHLERIVSKQNLKELEDSIDMKIAKKEAKKKKPKKKNNKKKKKYR